MPADPFTFATEPAAVFRDALGCDPICGECRRPVDDGAWFEPEDEPEPDDIELYDLGYDDDAEPEVLCRECCLGIARGIWESATALAESSVRVDPLPTPESLNLTATELELFGGVDGAYRMRARHDFSNYDLLILTLGPDPWDRLYWQAIRQRVDQMIAYAIERKSPTATACA